MGRHPLLAGLCLLIAATSRANAAPAPEHAQLLRVLVLTSGPSRDFLFLQSLLMRERTRQKIAAWAHPQHNPDTVDKDAIQAGQLPTLERFPERLIPEGNKFDARAAALGSYDVVIAFDPDWGKLSEAQCKALRAWVHQGGTLIMVAGPLHTNQLARRGIPEHLRRIEGILPVRLEDDRLFTRDTGQPWRLNFGKVKPEMTFMKLDPEGKEPLAGWEEFFSGARSDQEKDRVQRGFFSVYPTSGWKPDSVVLATSAEPRTKKDERIVKPFLGGWLVDKGQVIYLGSGETWRLRQYREAFHERFWTELIRFAGKDRTSLKPP